MDAMARSDGEVNVVTDETMGAEDPLRSTPSALAAKPLSASSP